MQHKRETQPLPQIKPNQSDTPCSPWTEPFQAAQQAATPAPRSQATWQAQRPADADTQKPTQDALSTIFNGS